MEIHAQVAGHPRYWVTDLGRVYSEKAGRYIKGMRGAGYVVVRFYRQGGFDDHLVHRLVLETFVGPCPVGQEGCHINGDPFDNRLVNLRWDTHVGNMNDRNSHGTAPKGSRHPRAKLSEAQVREIRTSSLRNVDLAGIYGMSVSAIRQARMGLKWRHI